MQAITYANNYLREKEKNLKQSYVVHIHHHVITLSDSNNTISAEIRVEKAIHSAFQQSLCLTDKQVHLCAIIHSPTFSSKSAAHTLLPMLCYFALRQARIWHCQHVISPTTDNDTLNQLLQLKPIAHLSPSISAQIIKYAIHRAYEACDQTQQNFIQTYFAHEILATFESWVTTLFNDSFFTAVKTRTLAKEQYISLLFNLYEFVKHTTRLAARCVAVCENRELRNHYIHHLRGEINHEVIIESDLKALHADVNYLMQGHVPHPATAEFIVLQESITGFRQDAILMLACPFVAEGMTANISSAFVDDLHACIKSWGIKSPEAVSRFLTSHMKTDGGDDGHWVRVIMMMDKFIKTENQFQQFLVILQLAMTGYAHGLNANINEMPLWCQLETIVTTSKTEAALV